MCRRVSVVIALMCAAIVATLAVATCIALERRRQAQEKRLLTAHDRAVAARKEQFDAREVTRQIAALDSGRSRQRQSYHEYTSALGGPVGAALNHPELTVLGMLQELALACAPRGTLPHVAVDRFTEFSLLLELPQSQPRSTLAEIARCLLPHSTQYLHSVRFSHRGALLGELDRSAIESVADWKSIPAADVEKLFADPEYSRPPTFVGAVSAPVEQQIQEPQNLPEEAKRQKAAEERFHEAYAQASALLRFAIDRQLTAVDLAGVKLVADLDARRKLLFDAESSAGEAKRILANPILEYERILQQQKLDPIYISAATRTAARVYTNSQPAVPKVFVALAERSRCAEEFLATMKRHFGAWTYQPFQDRIDFHDPTAERDHAAANKKFDAASRTLERAVDDWVRAIEQNSQTDKPSGGSDSKPGEL